MRILRNAGKRKGVGFGEMKEINRAIKLAAEGEDASKSWVRNFIIGQFFGIPVPDFKQEHRKRLPKRK